ncbi:MAG: hypothetical protein CVT64_09205 [Actinobacteria bacterium HGW-Actinobacteria-4]|nr:MAG: hypothetical protein CVT64_09205 [Actinobacteria bacterium HGW-Actinobacteria-4]
MAETKSSSKPLGKFSSIAQIHWVAGLVAAVVLSHILALVVIGLDNEWALLFLLGIISLIIAAVVGFAVRLTSSASVNQTFLAAFVTAGLGVHLIVGAAGRGFDDFGYTMLTAYLGSPINGYVIFFGVVAGLVATVGRRA